MVGRVWKRDGMKKVVRMEKKILLRPKQLSKLFSFRLHGKIMPLGNDLGRITKTPNPWLLN